MPLRDHAPSVINHFGGLWDQGSPIDIPQDHFWKCENVRFHGSNSIASRYGTEIYDRTSVPLGNIVRIYNYVTQTANTILALVWDGSYGHIYHVVDGHTILGPILSKQGMTDFGFGAYAGRAYLSPFASYENGDLFVEKGLPNEHVYVYNGDGTISRPAGGEPPIGTLSVANGSSGHTDPGQHLFAVVFETSSGFLSAPGGFVSLVTLADKSLNFTNIPISSDTNVVKRHLVATKVIPDGTYNGNLTGYQYFFIPDGTINDNISTDWGNISFFDADLLEDASYLHDNFTKIPAGAGINFYGNRMCVWAPYTDISLCYVSAPGEPEAVSQLDGFIVAPLDGNPITYVQELRDVLYVFKRNRTFAYIGDVDTAPAEWAMSTIDQAIGCPVHGVATVLDSGGASVDFLIVASFAGITIFNGHYTPIELTWKIYNFWSKIDRKYYKKIQLLNDSINKTLYAVLPDGRMLIGDYQDGLNPTKICWTPWKFVFSVSSVALVNIDDLIIASDGRYLEVEP